MSSAVTKKKRLSKDKLHGGSDDESMKINKEKMVNIYL